MLLANLATYCFVAAYTIVGWRWLGGTPARLAGC